MSQAQPQERVAVVVVHGVADQRPGETVRQLARLLCHGAAGQPRFVRGEVQEVLVPVARLEPGDARAARLAEEEQPSRTQHRPGALSGFFRHSQIEQGREQPTPQQDLGTDLSDYLLSRLELSDGESLYEGTRIGLEHRASGRPVDLFEMYWADLSRLGHGGLAALSSLYRLFITLSTLAADVVDQASMKQAHGSGWRALQRLHAWAAWLLRGPSLLIQLAMLLLFVCGAFAIVPYQRHDQVLIALFCVAAVALIGLTIFLHVRSNRRWLPPVTGLLALGCLAFTVLAQWGERSYLFVYFGAMVVLLLGAGGWLVERYARRVRGVRVTGLLLVALTMLLLLSEARRVWPSVTTEQEWILSAALGVGEHLYALILLTWAVFVVVQLAALLLGLWLGRNATDAVRRSLHTARLGLVSAAAVFAILSLVLWSVLSYIASYWLDDIGYQARFFDAGSWPSGASYLDARVRSLGGFFTPLVVLSTLVGIAGFMVVAPALLEEVKPTTNIDVDGPRAGAERWSQRLGAWLSKGMGTIGLTLRWLIPLGAIAGSVLYLAFVARQFAFVLGFEGFALDPVNAWLDFFRGETLVAAGKWLAGGALTVTALGSRFNNTFGRLRVALDAMADISNYFDDPPDGQSPRARIYSRYAALLSYVREAGYARVVIVAHSQGTVISADLLRYLHVQGRLRQVTGGLPVALVTVGSPLRDLYAQRFPLLYEWLGRDPVDFDAAVPRAADIGAQEWVNVCRAGDYVGRFIWTPRTSGAFAVATLDEHGRAVAHRAGDRIEFCLGAGGHTRYFSNDALVLARELERLIVAPTATLD